MRLVLHKAGPYVGPRGGKWADLRHTRPWQPRETAAKHDADLGKEGRPTTRNARKRVNELRGTSRKEIPRYKMSVELADNPKEATSLAEALKNGIGKAADICKISPPVCEGNMGIPRADMPQLKPEVVQAFLDSWKDKGVQVKTVDQHVGRLKATQREINAQKVIGMAKRVKSGKFDPSDPPIIVSNDGYILDGHHRWATLLAMDPDNSMSTHVVDVPMKELLKAAKDFKGVTQSSFEKAMSGLFAVLGVPDLVKGKGVADEATWERAKKQARKQEGAEDFYALVSHIYQKMGGTYTKKAKMKKAKMSEGPGDCPLTKAGGPEFHECESCPKKHNCPDRKVKKSESAIDILNDLSKAGGPYIGPKGGKWADAKHTIPWKEGSKNGARVRATSVISRIKSLKDTIAGGKQPHPNDVRSMGIAAAAAAREHPETVASIKAAVLAIKPHLEARGAKDIDRLVKVLDAVGKVKKADGDKALQARYKAVGGEICKRGVHSQSMGKSQENHMKTEAQVLFEVMATDLQKAEAGPLQSLDYTGGAKDYSDAAVSAPPGVAGKGPGKTDDIEYDGSAMDYSDQNVSAPSGVGGTPPGPNDDLQYDDSGSADATEPNYDKDKKKGTYTNPMGAMAVFPGGIRDISLGMGANGGMQAKSEEAKNEEAAAALLADRYRHVPALMRPSVEHVYINAAPARRQIIEPLQLQKGEVDRLVDSVLWDAYKTEVQKAVLDDELGAKMAKAAPTSMTSIDPELIKSGAVGMAPIESEQVVLTAAFLLKSWADQDPVGADAISRFEVSRTSLTTRLDQLGFTPERVLLG